MKWFKLLMVLCVLALWLGATNHCSLENIPALKFLVCNPHGETQPHQDNDCEKDSCSTVEKASYKTETAQITAPSPVLFLTGMFLPELEVERPFPGVLDTASAPASELPAGWQFSYRTAAPPRAPSFVS